MGFSKSSPVSHNWLLNKSPFSDSIQNWQQYQIIPVKIKWIASISIVTSYTVTLLIVTNAYILIALGIGFLGLLAFILSKPGEIIFEPKVQ